MSRPEIKPIRTARPRDSRVHEYVPTNDPRRRIRVPKGRAEDAEALQDSYVERFFKYGERWGRTQLEIDRLADEQKVSGERAKAVGRRTEGLVRGLIVSPEGQEEGLDVLITPAMAIEVTSERAFRKGNVALFQATTNPEWVFQLRVPDSLRGENKPIDQNMVRAFFEGIASAMGIDPERFESLFTAKRELNPKKDAIRSVIKGGIKVPGVKATQTWSIDAKPIPPESTS